jgi:predicted RNA binding protein YcfA (HicA-like mRNA interferase family)
MKRTLFLFVIGTVVAAVKGSHGIYYHDADDVRRYVDRLLEVQS